MGEDDNLSVELLAKLVANKYQYLMVLFDGEYQHFVIEVLDPYGEGIVAGLGTTLQEAVNDAVKELKSIE